MIACLSQVESLREPPYSSGVAPDCPEITSGPDGAAADAGGVTADESEMLDDVVPIVSPAPPVPLALLTPSALLVAAALFAPSEIGAATDGVNASGPGSAIGCRKISPGEAGTVDSAALSLRLMTTTAIPMISPRITTTAAVTTHPLGECGLP